ncbi:hypothetical protein HanRHA438_Chr01g0013831 [Helianthus annuus]|nr:hypothetical protein HanRHA438_Chr01g0013831 [Helianthus annuus]
MDAREWKASMNRIESTLFEIINLLKEESRRWATAPIFSIPRPVFVNVPPTSSPAAATPPTTATPKPTLKPIPTPLAPTLVLSPQKATVTKPSSKPTPTQILIKTSMVSSRLKKVVSSPPTTKQMASIKGVVKKLEWRPPWRYIETAPNATVRVEWRPPWSI